MNILQNTRIIKAKPVNLDTSCAFWIEDLKELVFVQKVKYTRRME